ncbi:MAG: lipid-A-disaccharide synthase [Bacteroidales bacterium]
MKYYIIAGEASGDLHAANLMRELKKLDGDARFRAWGGELMENQGAGLVKHYRDLAFMGFAEVIANLGTIYKNLSLCKKDIVDYSPDVLILVDYPGFNLRMAEFAHRKGFRVFYYISPQVWAWKKSRVHKIRKYVDRMFVILPFEQEFYKKYEVDVSFVGHPLLDAIEAEKQKLGTLQEFKTAYGLDHRPIIAILPGSRKQEISTMLPVMASVIPDFPDYQFIIAAAPSIPDDFYTHLLPANHIKKVTGKTHELLHHSIAALVTSGTATLETALLGIPQVVCYKGNYVSYQIAKRIVDIKYISLVNLIMDKEVVTELIQREMNRTRLSTELKKLISGEKRQQILADYDKLREKLGGTGASELAAKLMIGELGKL